jgi:hypothetical protein
MKVTLLKKNAIISLLFTLFSIIFSKLYAQNKVEGLLKDAKENNIGFTPVVFASTNDTLNFDYTITDRIGKFNFKVTKSGVYFIKGNYFKTKFYFRRGCYIFTRSSCC